MITRKYMIEKLGDEYKDMFNQISIPDFYKCVAEFSGLKIQSVSDESVEDYLTNWAINKKRFFKMLGNKVVNTVDFVYDSSIESDAIENMYQELKDKNPLIAPWLSVFENFKKNKIVTNDICYPSRNILYGFLENKDYSVEGMKITTFFKRYLSAPDEIVTEIGRIYENKDIESNFSVSIDPVDMMLASENPYNWTSCYRLEPDNDGSHADGCLAAVCDSTSLITYLWDREGEFTLNKRQHFKSIKYKKMRMWIAISKDFDAIHFNSIYPGVNNYENEFKKKIRDIVENLAFRENLTAQENIWVGYGNRDLSTDVEMVFLYGYTEFSRNNVWVLKDSKITYMPVYDTALKCPCGCGTDLMGSSDECSDYEYYGSGFICSNYGEREYEDEYCEYADDTCSYAGCICESCCEGCSHWDEAHREEEEDVDAINDEEKCNGNCNCCSGCGSQESSNENNSQIITETCIHRMTYNIDEPGIVYLEPILGINN